METPKIEIKELTDTVKTKITETIKKIGGFMSLEFEVECRDSGSEGEAVMISIYTPNNANFLIGREGNNLKALEHILKVMLSKESQILGRNISVDINDYKKFRSQLVIDIAKQAVGRVRNNLKAEALLPMSAYERKIVHTELASCPDIITESIGEGLQRRIVIKPYP